jgi:CheY-like chemotaxis protein
MSRILIVDDSPIVRVAVERLARGLGHETVAVESAELATGVLDATPIDVVLTDYRLGSSDGLSLASLVRGRWPWIPVVLMSGTVDRDLDRRAREAGVVRCLEKPFQGPVLVAAVAAALGHGVQGHSSAEAQPDSPHLCQTQSNVK